jgi:hypothetical protein
VSYHDSVDENGRDREFDLSPSVSHESAQPAPRTPGGRCRRTRGPARRRNGHEDRRGPAAQARYERRGANVPDRGYRFLVMGDRRRGGQQMIFRTGDTPQLRAAKLRLMERVEEEVKNYAALPTSSGRAAGTSAAPTTPPASSVRLRTAGIPSARARIRGSRHQFSPT